MKELIKQLSNISDAYDDFILGVMNYVKRDSSHVELLNSFLRDNSDITSSVIPALSGLEGPGERIIALKSIFFKSLTVTSSFL